MAVFRSSHWRCSVKIGDLKNFTKFTGKQLCQSLFLRVSLTLLMQYNLNLPNFFGIKKCFDNKSLGSLTKDLNLICDKNGLIRCQGKLKNASLPYDTKTANLLNSNPHYICKLFIRILLDFINAISNNSGIVTRLLEAFSKVKIHINVNSACYQTWIRQKQLLRAVP